MGVNAPLGVGLAVHLEVKIMLRNGLLIITVLFLVACGASQLTWEDLGKTEWKLISLNNQEPISGSMATLNFYEDSLNGTTGCNVYHAGYTLKGDKISISDMLVTEQYCENPPGIMDQEKIYTEIMVNAVRVLVENDQLMLLTEDSRFLLFGKSVESSIGE
jgi:heat shock protein HslJ